jgi:acetyl esterase/lipase
MKHCLLVFAGLLLTPCLPAAEPGVESNVVYGMYSGAALLMDVHRPAAGNGCGVIHISGSGWHAPQEYGAQQLKDSNQVGIYGKPLVQAGYTVFNINHRAAPRFRYPAAVEDAQRAVRFIRHNAARFGIRADSIGAAGGSSGGHLVSMLGGLDGKGHPSDPDPVERESAKVRCVMARAAPSDLTTLNTVGGSAVVSFVGMPLRPNPPKTSIEYKTYREASLISHVSPDDPPFLLLHGDADETVPYSQSEEMETALRKQGVTVRLIRIAGGGHGPTFAGAKNPPDYLGEMIRWFDKHLRGAR